MVIMVSIHFICEWSKIHVSRHFERVGLAIMERRKRENNRGTALFVAIVVCAIVMVFSLALLSLSYSVFSGEIEKTSSLAMREMVKSFGKTIQGELSVTGEEGSLADMIRQKISLGTWESGVREYYALTPKEAEGELGNLASMCEVCFYWENEKPVEGNMDETVEKTGEEADVYIDGDVYLHVIISCDDGRERYVWEDRYLLDRGQGTWTWILEQRGVSVDE